MRQLFLNLWSDDSGAVLAVEWLFLVVILVIGLVTGVIAIRNAVVEELAEFANALTALDKGYSFDGLHSCGASTAGTKTTDQPSRGHIGKFGSTHHEISVNTCETF